MNFQIPAPTEPLTPEQGQRISDLLTTMKVAHIEVISFSGERLRPGLAPNTTFDLAIGAGVSDGRLQYRFDTGATLNGEDDQAVGTIKASLLVAFEMPADFEAEPWIVEQIGRTAIHICLPHLREVIQSLATRLGYFGVTMPILVLEANKGLAE